MGVASFDSTGLRHRNEDPRQSSVVCAGEFAQSLQYFIQNEAPMTHQSTLKSWMNKEFSTFIAHEKAQDSYLIDQMLENLKESDEDLDSTSLISSDVIDQLNQYTAQQLEKEGHESYHTAPQEVDEAWAKARFHDTQSVPSDLATQETSPPVHQQNSKVQTHRAEQELKSTIPISEQALLSLHQATDEMQDEVFNSLQSSSPFSSTDMSFQTQKDYLNQDELEELLEESFEDSLDDESDIFNQEHDLDHILSVSLSQSTPSPIGGLHTPQPSAHQIGSHQGIGQHAESVVITPSNHQPRTPPQASIDPRQVSPNLSSDAGQITPPVFSDYEPTPVPQMRRVRTPRSSSGKGRSKVMMFLLIMILAGGGYGAWLYLQPQATQLQLQVQPSDLVTVKVGMNTPVLLSSQKTFEVVHDQMLKIQHPELPTWSKELTAQDLKQGVLKINLEDLAPRVPLVVRSNRSGAKVWVLGLLRGEIQGGPKGGRFEGKVPINPHGKIKVKLTYPELPPVEKTVTRKRNKFFTYIRFD